MPTLGAKNAPKMGHPDFWNFLELGHLSNPLKSLNEESYYSC
jgi:hypothetical protein